MRRACWVHDSDDETSAVCILVLSLLQNCQRGTAASSAWPGRAWSFVRSATRRSYNAIVATQAVGQRSVRPSESTGHDDAAGGGQLAKHKMAV